MPLMAKKLVTNEAMQPIAVQIDYADWLKIEALLEQHAQKPTDPSPDITVWQNQWCELAQKIDHAWKSNKSAVELLAEMRQYPEKPALPIELDTWLGCMSETGKIMGDIVAPMDDNISIWEVLAQ